MFKRHQMRVGAKATSLSKQLVGHSQGGKRTETRTMRSSSHLQGLVESGSGLMEAVDQEERVAQAEKGLRIARRQLCCSLKAQRRLLVLLPALRESN